MIGTEKITSIAAVTLAITMLAPMSAMAAPASGSGSDLTYDATKAAVMEKAQLLTGKYGATSVQYALMCICREKWFTVRDIIGKQGGLSSGKQTVTKGSRCTRLFVFIIFQCGERL
ncbi:hypothetical protein ABGV42_03695 [Paenibacillus pabuli]|uniref:hypothetical protein n=1 Tax=Paenibacillus pabuli TaxID=1472 RepID=UPI0032423C6D